MIFHQMKITLTQISLITMKITSKIILLDKNSKNVLMLFMAWTTIKWKNNLKKASRLLIKRRETKRRYNRKARRNMKKLGITIQLFLNIIGCTSFFKCYQLQFAFSAVSCMHSLLLLHIIWKKMLFMINLFLIFHKLNRITCYFSF